MPKFVYEGPAEKCAAGIANAVYRRGQIEEVPDERQAALLRTLEGFREVRPEEVPVVPNTLMPMPTQGAPHPVPAVSAMLRNVTLQGEKLPAAGNLSRDDQREANIEGLVERQESLDQAAEQPKPRKSKPPSPEKTEE
jgi:hypothetical protein